MHGVDNSCTQQRGQWSGMSIMGAEVRLGEPATLAVCRKKLEPTLGIEPRTPSLRELKSAFSRAPCTLDTRPAGADLPENLPAALLRVALNLWCRLQCVVDYWRDAAAH